MNKIYEKLEEKIDRKIKNKNKCKKFIGDLKIITSLGWIFIIPVLIFLFIGSYIKNFFSIYSDFVMFIFILLGFGISCINIIYVIKSLYEKKGRK